ncbi:MAG: hypothetical protein WC516_06395 [Patescibacteria group bacterium]
MQIDQVNCYAVNKVVKIDSVKELSEKEKYDIREGKIIMRQGKEQEIDRYCPIAKDIFA